MFCLTRGDYCTEVSRKDTHAQHERRWNGVHLASRQVGVSEDPERPQVSIACDSASEPGRSTLNVLNYKYKYFLPQKYLSTSTFLFGEMYLSTFRVLSKCT